MIRPEKQGIAPLIVKIAFIFVLNLLPSADAGTKEGKAAFEAKNYSVAFQEFSAAATAGDAEAQFFLSNLYFYGQGVAKDAHKSFEWIKKSAEQGYPKGQRNLAMNYEEGIAVPRDYKKAMFWFLKASAQGELDSKIGIGRFYMGGLGVPKDYSLAFKWHSEAANLGSPWGQNILGTLYAFGIGTTADQKMAAEWYAKSSKQGFADAQYNLGMAFRNGEGLVQNDQKALDLFKKSAMQNNPDALNQLGLIYENGENGIFDDSLSYVFYNLAAVAGSSEGKDSRDRMKAKLTTAELAEAQTLASKWKVGQALPNRQQSRWKQMISWAKKIYSNDAPHAALIIPRPDLAPSPPKPALALSAKSLIEGMSEESWTQGVLGICDTLGDGTDLHRFCANPTVDKKLIEKVRCVCRILDKPRTSFCKIAMQGVFASCSTITDQKKAGLCLSQTTAQNMENMFRSRIQDCDSQL